MPRWAVLALKDVSITQRQALSSIWRRTYAPGLRTTRLIDRKVLTAVNAIFVTEPAGEFMLKGLHSPTAAFNVVDLREQDAS